MPSTTLGAITIRNPREAVDAFEVPLRPDDTPYRFEMIYDDMRMRAYADDASALLGCLIAGYPNMDAAAQTAARLSHAVRTQVSVQAAINYHYDDLTGVDPDEYAVLTRTRAEAPQVDTWSSHVPLVLVDAFYRPFGDLPAPVSAIADVEDPPNLYWMRVGDEYGYLVSLASLGLIVLSEHADSA